MWNCKTHKIQIRNPYIQLYSVDTLSMYNIKTLSLNEPKMKIVHFVNDLKKEMRLIVLFLYM